MEGIEIYSHYEIYITFDTNLVIIVIITNCRRVLVVLVGYEILYSVRNVREFCF